MRFTFALAAGVLALSGCNQTATEIAPETDTPEEAGATLSGGFGEANAEAEETKAAEGVAIAAIYEAHPTRMLPTVLSRDVQVVAGLNYRFRIGMGGGANDVKKAYEVTVYRDLEGNMQVTSLTEVE